MRVLIIEDEAMLAAAIQTSVEDLGHTVVGIADDLDSAKICFDKQAPDLILSDFKLARSKLNGVEVVAKLIGNHPIKCIFMSAYPESDLNLESLHLPNCVYLPKPFGTRQLREAFDKL